MKAALIAIAGLLVVSVRAQDCPTPSYTEDIVPKCLSNRKILLPSYADPMKYYDCSTGSPVLTSCKAPTSYFSYVLQQCSTCANYIPAAQCSQIKLGLQCQPIDKSTSTTSLTTTNTPPVTPTTPPTTTNTPPVTPTTPPTTTKGPTGTPTTTEEPTTTTTDGNAPGNFSPGFSQSTTAGSTEAYNEGDTTVYVPPPPSPNNPNVPAPPTPPPTVGTVATGPPVVQ